MSFNGTCLGDLPDVLLLVKQDLLCQLLGLDGGKHLWKGALYHAKQPLCLCTLPAAFQHHLLR